MRKRLTAMPAVSFVRGLNVVGILLSLGNTFLMWLAAEWGSEGRMPWSREAVAIVSLWATASVLAIVARVAAMEERGLWIAGPIAACSGLVVAGLFVYTSTARGFYLLLDGAWLLIAVFLLVVGGMYIVHALRLSRLRDEHGRPPTSE
jgi:hypothetical protein